MATLSKAIDLLESQQYEEAQALLEELAMDNPKDADVLYNLGMCYTEQGNPEAAVRTLDQCITHQAHLTNAYVARGYAKMLLDQPTAAIDDLETALAHDPHNIHALRNMGGAYGKLDQYEKALVYLKRAYDIAPENPQVAYGLGYAYKQLGDYQRADEIFKIMLDGYLPDKYRELAEAERREIADVPAGYGLIGES